MLLLSVGVLPAQGAELRLSPGAVVPEGGAAYIEVDVSWRLSRRNETNWDAAWLFGKVQGSRGNLHVPLAPRGHSMTRNGQ